MWKLASAVLVSEKLGRTLYAGIVANSSSRPGSPTEVLRMWGLASQDR